MGTVVGRSSDPLNQLGMSALLILGCDPSQLFGAGFQLSFTAVLGILLFVDKLSFFFHREKITQLALTPLQRMTIRRQFVRYTNLSFCVTLAAWLSTLPLTALYFNRVAPLALLANLFACPLVFFILCACLVSMPVAWLLPSVGGLGLAAAGWLVWLLKAIVQLLAATPFSGIHIGPPDTSTILLYYGCVALFVFRLNLRLGVWHVVAVGCVAVIFVFGYPLLERSAERDVMRMTVLDVGHGTATLLELPDGSNLLFDVGSAKSADITQWTVGPFLRSKGIRCLDRVLVSHMDSDHYSGLPTLLEHFKVKKLYVPIGFDRQLLGLKLLDRAKARGAEVNVIHDGVVLCQSGDLNLTILNPPANPQEVEPLSDNNTSLVLRAKFGSTTFLLCGDIEEYGITRISNHKEEVKADVILVPHHGSFASNTEDLVKRVQPRYAIMSAWENRVSRRTLNAYERSGTDVRITGREGAVTIIADGEQVKVESSFKMKDSSQP